MKIFKLDSKFDVVEWVTLSLRNMCIIYIHDLHLFYLIKRLYRIVWKLLYVTREIYSIKIIKISIAWQVVGCRIRPKKKKKSIVSSMKHLKQVFRCLLSYTLIIPSICVCCFIRLVPKFLHRYALVSLTFPGTSSICLYIIK